MGCTNYSIESSFNNSSHHYSSPFPQNPIDSGAALDKDAATRTNLRGGGGLSSLQISVCVVYAVYSHPLSLQIVIRNVHGFCSQYSPEFGLHSTQLLHIILFLRDLSRQGCRNQDFLLRPVLACSVSVPTQNHPSNAQHRCTPVESGQKST